jgi:hypothetical protein
MDVFGGRCWWKAQILYDNTKLAVAKILGDERRRGHSANCSHYLFAEKFGRRGKGNDKDQASYCTSLGVLNAS